MPTLQDYAALSSRVYFRTQKNRTPLDQTNWTELQYQGNVNASGFSAGVYRQSGTSNIVIAYTGTNEHYATDFWTGNIPAFKGTVYVTQKITQTGDRQTSKILQPCRTTGRCLVTKRLRKNRVTFSGQSKEVCFVSFANSIFNVKTNEVFA